MTGTNHKSLHDRKLPWDETWRRPHVSKPASAVGSEERHLPWQGEKLTLIAPAKKNIVCGLRFKDFHNGFHKVCVNNIEIAIPNGLRRDILSSLKPAEKRQMRAEFVRKTVLRT